MNILIVILSLVVLITLHELGHFLFAKKFDVKVHEFGIGIPPRMVGKKIGETIYSINWIPLGGFVRMLGEDERVDDERSFSQKPAWQRAIILVAGVASFWLVAILIFAIVSFGWGVMTEVPDDVDSDSFLMVNWIESEAEGDGLQLQDRIIKVGDNRVDTISGLEDSLDESSAVTVIRGDQEVDLTLEEDLSGVDVRRVSMVKKSAPQALAFGVRQTVNVTRLQAGGLWMALKGAVTGEGLPEGMELGGPVMIGDMATDALDRGVGDYLMFVGMIATILAFMNILPIPALDGGRLLFLAVEKVKGSPIPEKVERNVNAVFFLLLIVLMVVVTVRDLFNIF